MINCHENNVIIQKNHNGTKIGFIYASGVKYNFVRFTLKGVYGGTEIIG